MLATLGRRLSAIATLAVFGLVLVGVPLFEIRHGNWPGAGVPWPPKWPALRSGDYVDGVERRLSRHSQIASQVGPLYQEAEYVLTGQLAEGVVAGGDDWLFASERMRAPSPEERERVRTGMEALGRVLRRLEANGTRVVIELSPRKTSLYPDMVPASHVPRTPSDYQFVLDALRAQGLTAPDLRPALLEGGVMRFFTNDVHWNSEGVRTGARVAADALLERMGGDPLPGPSFSGRIELQKARPFHGRQQRELGFRPGGHLYERFLDEDRPLFVMREGRKREYRAVREERPVVHVGSSMSTGLTTTAAMLSTFLGVEVEDRARPGFEYSYRLAGLIGQIWTGRREPPAALILEFPEDFPLYEGRYFFEPIEALLKLGRGAPYAMASMPAREARLTGVRTMKGEGELLRGRLLNQASSLTWRFPQPVSCRDGAAVAFRWTYTAGDRYRTDLVVEWLRVGDERVLGRRRIHLGQSRWMHSIQVPLEGPGRQRIGAVRVRPRAAGNTFLCGPLELWLPVNPR